MWQDVRAPSRQPEKNGKTEVGSKLSRTKGGWHLMKDVGEASVTLAGIWHRP